jgi:hypothetical protein
MQQTSTDDNAMAVNSDPQETSNLCTSNQEGRLTRRSVLGSLLAGVAISALPAAAQPSPSRNGISLGAIADRAIPLDYLGLSYETAQLADPTFFAADNRELVSLFRTLSSQGVLRIGGNSSEFCWWKTKPNQSAPPMPASSHADGNWMPQKFTAIEPVAIDHLAEFLDATGWKAIYGLNLGTGSPERDAEEAAYVARILGTRLLYFQIGNEPEYYSDANNRLRAPNWDFEQYFAQWTAFVQAVTQRVPDARFGGPDVGSNADWVIQFAERAPKALPRRIVACTSHYYAEGPPDSPFTTVARLLARNPKFESALDRVTAAAMQAGIAYRMTEGNTCYRGGKPGLSNAFCSALWAADYLLLLASRGAVGVNLHGGGSQQIRFSLGGHLPGESLAPGADPAAALGSFYTPIAGSREAHFSARPVFYGMKIAGLLAGGRMRSVLFDTPPADARAWAAETPSGEIRIVVVNKDPQQDLDLRVPSKGAAELWRLEAPNLSATSGVTLAGAECETGKGWRPRQKEHLACRSGSITVQIPRASAAILFLPNVHS